MALLHRVEGAAQLAELRDGGVGSEAIGRRRVAAAIKPRDCADRGARRVDDILAWRAAKVGDAVDTNAAVAVPAALDEGGKLLGLQRREAGIAWVVPGGQRVPRSMLSAVPMKGGGGGARRSREAG